MGWLRQTNIRPPVIVVVCSRLVTGVSIAMALTLMAIAPATAQSRQSCTIMINEDGRLAPNADNTSLSSRNQGGRPAEVTVSATNSRYSVYLDKPFGFALAPPGGNDDVRFRVSYSGRGRVEFSRKPARIPTRIRRGDTRLTINMTADRLSGSFPGGNYRTGVTVRCE